MTGECDCGATYDVGSRLDHDGDTGQCWSCSDRDPDKMTSEQWSDYLLGK